MYRHCRPCQITSQPLPAEYSFIQQQKQQRRLPTRRRQWRQRRIRAVNFYSSSSSTSAPPHTLCTFRGVFPQNSFSLTPLSLRFSFFCRRLPSESPFCWCCFSCCCFLLAIFTCFLVVFVVLPTNTDTAAALTHTSMERAHTRFATSLLLFYAALLCHLFFLLLLPPSSGPFSLVSRCCNEKS